MAGYIIYARDDLTNDTTAYEIDDIKCTVEKLFRILKINPDIYTLSFGDEELNELDEDTMLADIGLCSECTVSISTDYSPNELKIINEYSFEALAAYAAAFSLSTPEIEYDEFVEKYRGYFSNTDKFVDHCLENEEAYDTLSWHLKEIIDKEKEYLYDFYMDDYYTKYNHYFWIH